MVMMLMMTGKPQDFFFNLVGFINIELEMVA